MATPSPQYSLGSRGESLDRGSSKSHNTQPLRKLKRLQSAHNDEQQSESKCKRCGWKYPTQNPNSRHRRDHKRRCPKHSSTGSEEEETRRSSGGRYLPPGELGRSIQTGDHDLRDTTRNGKTLNSSKMDEKVKESEDTQDKTGRAVNEKLAQGSCEVPERERDDQPDQSSSKMPTNSNSYATGTEEEKLRGCKDKELGPQYIAMESQVAHSPRNESDEETGNGSGVASTVGEHETDSFDDMGFDSSDITEVAKRENSLASGDDMNSLPSDADHLIEEKHYGAIQHQKYLARLGEAASSHRADSDGDGKPVNVASLIAKYNKGIGSSASLPLGFTSTYRALAGDQRTIPSAKIAEAGQLSSRSKDHEHGGEAAPARNILEEGWLSTTSGAKYALEAIWRRHKTHDLICPRCGSHINYRIIVRKQRTFVGKNEDPTLPALTKNPSADQDTTVKIITAEDHETWVERCFSYLGLFRRDS